MFVVFINNNYRYVSRLSVGRRYGNFVLFCSISSALWILPPYLKNPTYQGTGSVAGPMLVFFQIDVLDFPFFSKLCSLYILYEQSNSFTNFCLLRNPALLLECLQLWTCKNSYLLLEWTFISFSIDCLLSDLISAVAWSFALLLISLSSSVLVEHSIAFVVPSHKSTMNHTYNPLKDCYFCCSNVQCRTHFRWDFSPCSLQSYWAVFRSISKFSFS